MVEKRCLNHNTSAFTGSPESIQECRELQCPHLQYQDGIYGCFLLLDTKKEEVKNEVR